MRRVDIDKTRPYGRPALDICIEAIGEEFDADLTMPGDERVEAAVKVLLGIKDKESDRGEA